MVSFQGQAVKLRGCIASHQNDDPLSRNPTIANSRASGRTWKKPCMVEEHMVNSHNYHRKPEAWFSCALYKAAVFFSFTICPAGVRPWAVTIWQNWQMTVRPRDFWKKLAHRSRVIGGPPNHFPCMIWAGSPYNPGPMCHVQLRKWPWSGQRSSQKLCELWAKFSAMSGTQIYFYRWLAGTKHKTVVFFLVCVFSFGDVRLLFLHVLTRLNSVPFSTSSCSSFAEILSQPTNEKYRSLRKDNAVVKVPTRE